MHLLGLQFANHVLFSCSDMRAGSHGEDWREDIKIKNISENTRGASPAALVPDLCLWLQDWMPA